MRDRIVHQYFRVDLDIIWQTVTTDIPEVRSQVELLYDELLSDKT